MALFGWASIGETGHATKNDPGDQKQTVTTGNDTKGEVKVGKYYSFGQTFAIRYKSASKAKKHANALLFFCNSKHVGYDMGLSDRVTLHKAITKLGKENYEKLSTDVETDCSDLQDVCADIAGAITTDAATGQMKEKYGGNSDFIILTDKKYLESGDYCLEGDMIVAPGHHVIGCIEAGSKAANETREITSAGCATKAVSNEKLTKVTYIGFKHGKDWGKEIVGYNTVDNMGYAGSIGTALDAVTMKVSEGGIIYSVHEKGRGWSSERNSYGKTNPAKYAGTLGVEIDAIAIKAVNITGKLKYRAYKHGKGWGNWITGFSKTDTNKYAGSIGTAIDAIQIGIE